MRLTTSSCLRTQYTARYYLHSTVLCLVPCAGTLYIPQYIGMGVPRSRHARRRIMVQRHAAVADDDLDAEADG